ncbi:protocatechuate 3,4-dioxygenase [Vibrio mediterranei]|uniref:dioxygenase family protein n=1 Tax=Vibrio barjaei TaxID=1676683 RepID=UPI0007BB6220|nr:protocatechuate 3,4-dioxygenase [Vibrio barjaei]MCG9788630.1 protocatechuate 3,4-dioxygenase [Vibrio mediterranei]OIN26740.1 protocatechuate 3,4-dioxygenase [Vibrio barjaei]
MQRRQFITVCSIWFAWPVLAKTPLPKTPSQAEGPFYPVTNIPVRSNLILDSTKLTGKPFQLSGKVKNSKGEPLAGIRVEIWQCDGDGYYDHPKQPNIERFNRAFAGFGAVESDINGSFDFSTLFPVPYATRPPHIHVKLKKGDSEILTTQLYLRNQTGKEWWGGSEREQLQLDVTSNGEQLETYFQFVV